VLVVGYGNSGSEIALDLWEYGARPSVIIRSPVNILPRTFTRILSNLYPVARQMPAAELDRNQPLVYSLLYGDSLSSVNITLKDVGAVTDIATRHRAPVQDIGTLDLILKGEIPVISHEIKEFVGSTVC
jgi:indole-3-pyruvate monooxygenase